MLGKASLIFSAKKEEEKKGNKTIRDIKRSRIILIKSQTCIQSKNINVKLI